MPRRVLLLTFLLTIPALAQQSDQPDIAGYVTRAAGPSDFDINGIRVIIHKNTALRRDHLGQIQSIEVPAPYLGQRADLWGDEDQKSLTFRPSRLVFYDPRPARVNGTGIIDLASTGNVYRADGRLLDLSNTTLTPMVPVPAGTTANATPPTPAQDLHTNIWLNYRGLRQPNGTIAVEAAAFTPNEVEKTEAKILKKTDYDPAAVPEDSGEDPFKKFFLGANLKKIAPYQDVAMQARVDRIGSSLIPAYQRALPDTDPTRIHFRFQVVDESHWHDAISLSSGVILIPFQIVDRLPDDAMLAAVLADNIATALEKQGFRHHRERLELGAANDVAIAASALSSLNPIVGLAGAATSLTVLTMNTKLLSQEEQQSGRVALCLMHDAGYDIAKAPEAWWTLASGGGKKNPHREPPPPRAVNQFIELGTTWHPIDPTTPTLIPRPPAP